MGGVISSSVYNSLEGHTEEDRFRGHEVDECCTIVFLGSFQALAHLCPVCLAAEYIIEQSTYWGTLLAGARIYRFPVYAIYALGSVVHERRHNESSQCGDFIHRRYKQEVLRIFRLN